MRIGETGMKKRFIITLWAISKGSKSLQEMADLSGLISKGGFSTTYIRKLIRDGYVKHNRMFGRDWEITDRGREFLGNYAVCVGSRHEIEVYEVQDYRASKSG